MKERQLTTVVLKLEVVVNNGICELDEEPENLSFQSYHLRQSSHLYLPLASSVK